MHEKYEVGYPQHRGGFVKRPRYARGGANHNAFIVSVRPPGAYRGGGLMKTFHRYKIKVFTVTISLKILLRFGKYPEVIPFLPFHGVAVTKLRFRIPKVTLLVFRVGCRTLNNEKIVSFCCRVFLTQRMIQKILYFFPYIQQAQL